MLATKDELVIDFCGDGESIEVPHSREYSNGRPTHICKKTGLVMVKHDKTAKEIAQRWSDEIYGDCFTVQGDQSTSASYTAKIPAVKARQVYVADFADVHIGLKNKSLCDVGTGEGQFLKIIANSEYQALAFGIEPSSKNCALMEQNKVPCFCGTIEEYTNSKQFENKKFDVITIMWTLVNSFSCFDMVSAAYRMLKPDGYLVVAEGSRILVPFKKPMNMYFSNLPPELHPFHFSANSLKNLLSVCKFDIQHVNRFIDSDILCVIGKKVENAAPKTYEVDNYLDVYHFFERWHVETQMYFMER